MDSPHRQLTSPDQGRIAPSLPRARHAPSCNPQGPYQRTVVGMRVTLSVLGCLSACPGRSSTWLLIVAARFAHGGGAAPEHPSVRCQRAVRNRRGGASNFSNASSAHSRSAGFHPIPYDFLGEPKGEPIAADSQPCPATFSRIRAAQLLTRRRSTTPGNGQAVTGGQGVAGSNPAVPTGRQHLSNMCLLAGEPKGEPNRNPASHFSCQTQPASDPPTRTFAARPRPGPDDGWTTAKGSRRRENTTDQAISSAAFEQVKGSHIGRHPAIRIHKHADPAFAAQRPHERLHVGVRLREIRAGISQKHLGRLPVPRPAQVPQPPQSAAYRLAPLFPGIRYPVEVRGSRARPTGAR